MPSKWKAEIYKELGVAELNDKLIRKIINHIFTKSRILFISNECKGTRRIVGIANQIPFVFGVISSSNFSICGKKNPSSIDETNRPQRTAPAMAKSSVVGISQFGNDDFCRLDQGNS